jgi:hypothetical protein
MSSSTFCSGNNDAVRVGLAATGSDQTGLMQCPERITQLCQPTPQAAASCAQQYVISTLKFGRVFIRNQRTGLGTRQ